MAWFKGTATDYHDFLDVLKELVQDDHIASVVIANGGTGYALGDTITLAGGTKNHEPELEVTGVGGGIITAVHIADAGVYTSQAGSPVAQDTTSGSGINATFTLTYADTAWEVLIDYAADAAATAAIAVAGTGYTANDIVTVVGGSFTEAATVKILTVAGGVPQTIEVHTTVGDYITTPSNAVVTSGGTGTGLTLNMTWSNEAADEQKYLMIHNTTTDQYIGWRAFKETSPEDAFLLECTGFTGQGSVSTSWSEQPGSTSIRQTNVPLSGGGSPATINYWMSVHDLRITGAFKVASVYPNMYLGSIDPFLTEGEYAYPQLILGCMARNSPYTYGAADFAGMNNPGAWQEHATLYQGPGWLRNPGGELVQVANWEVSGGNPTRFEAGVKVSPSGGTDFDTPASPNDWYSTTDQNWRQIFDESLAINAPQDSLKRTNDLFVLIPVSLVEEDAGRLYGNLRGVFALDPDSQVSAEDRVFIGTAIYRCFQNCNKSNRNFFFCIREN